MRKTSLLLALILMVSFMATAEMAGPGPDSEPRLSASGGDETIATQSFQRYTVRAGDTLWDIAVRQKVALADLLAANHLTANSLLSVGQMLLIPGVANAPANAGSGATSLPATNPSLPALVRYTVQRGNTLWDIAMAYGVAVETVIKANHLSKDGVLAVGQELIIPAPKRTPAPGQLAPPAPPPAPVAVQTAAAASLANATGPSAAPIANDVPIAPTQAVSETLPTEAPPEISATEGVSETAAIEAPPIESAPPAPAPSDLALLVFTLINEKRAGHGLLPLAWSPVLAQAAQAHAEDCARRNFGSHVGSDGARLRERLARVGYHATNATENWVYSYNPRRGVDWWYNEPPGRDPHRRNILSNQYSEVGIGIVQDRSGLYYIIADFGRP